MSPTSELTLTPMCRPVNGVGLAGGWRAYSEATILVSAA
jgi:hypothetical protein